MVLTTVFLVGGMSVLLFANFAGVMHMAIVVIAVLTAALFGDLLALPALLVFFSKDRGESAAATGPPT